MLQIRIGALRHPNHRCEMFGQILEQHLGLGSCSGMYFSLQIAIPSPNCKASRSLAETQRRGIAKKGQWDGSGVQVLAGKAWQLPSVPRAHERRGPSPHSCPMTITCTLGCSYTHTHTHTQTHIHDQISLLHNFPKEITREVAEDFYVKMFSIECQQMPNSGG